MKLTEKLPSKHGIGWVHNTHDWGAEPWRYAIVEQGPLNKYVKDLYVFDADNRAVCLVATVKKNEQFTAYQIANAERIVASVNWCQP